MAVVVISVQCKNSVTNKTQEVREGVVEIIKVLIIFSLKAGSQNIVFFK